MSWRLNQFGFVEVDVTPEMLASAEKRNKSFYNKCGNAGTHRKDKSRQRNTGYIAEMAVHVVFPKLEFSDDPKVDFVFAGKTFDVKAQGCNSGPSPTFVGTLYEEQRDRHVDFLIFTRVKNDFSKVWIAGFMNKDEFLNIAKLIPAGVENNNFRYDQARFELEYNKMMKPQRFMSRKQA